MSYDVILAVITSSSSSISKKNGEKFITNKFQGSTGLVCIQIRQKVLVYRVFPSTELRSSVPRFQKLTDFTVSHPIQLIDIVNDKLCLATEKYVSFYSIMAETKRWVH